MGWITIIRLCWKVIGNGLRERDKKQGVDSNLLNTKRTFLSIVLGYDGTLSTGDDRVNGET